MKNIITTAAKFNESLNADQKKWLMEIYEECKSSGELSPLLFSIICKDQSITQEDIDWADKVHEKYLENLDQHAEEANKLFKKAFNQK